MSTGTKRPFEQGLVIAQEVVEKLRPTCQQIEIAGSIRRKRPMVGDIEIVAIPHYLRNIFQQVDYTQPSQLDLFLEEKGVNLLVGGKMYKKGQREKQKRFMYKGVQVDLFLVVPENWGIIYTIRTGSAEFSKWLVTSRQDGGAMPHGLKSDGGYLQRWDNDQWHIIPTLTEESVFEALGLTYIPTDCRDDQKWL